ncbi:MAG: hypothetical protein A3K09_02990 [Nitrospinae bacterium RIFCSPLOWO2_12_FULL_47_7]|nr:MAG: hypothetical protein A3K09_02990 [Nitrospinae bacterium RIFCSPLOWO2_12_FULL_47_7]
MKKLGQLKISLMKTGVYISEDLRQRPEVARGFCRGMNAEKITFALSDDFFVKTFLSANDTACPRLKIHDDGIRLVFGKEEVNAIIVPLPEFIKKQQNDITPASQNIELDGYCLNLFLRLMKKDKLNMATETILSVIRAAFEEGAADLVQLNMDYCADVQQGFQCMAPVIKEIKAQFRTFISLRGFPPKEKGDIDKIYAAGVDLLNYPFEGFSNRTDKSFPAKRVMQGLEYAVEIFPQGAVSTELVFEPGLDKSMNEKVDLLAQKGIIPFLRFPERMGGNMNDYAGIVDSLQHLAQSAQRHKLNLKWLFPACHLVTPLDTAFFTDDSNSARLTVRPVYQSKIGKRASEGFAALRRKLRVRNISDSFESSGL